jgi:hypothetical protein
MILQNWVGYLVPRLNHSPVHGHITSKPNYFFPGFYHRTSRRLGGAGI